MGEGRRGGARMRIRREGGVGGGECEMVGIVEDSETCHLPV